MKIKKLFLFLFIAGAVAVGLFSWRKNLLSCAKRVPVTELMAVAQEFEERAYQNELKLYASREKIDPSFWHLTIIPSSQTPVDIVIPLVEKDCEVVGHTVRSVRNLVEHPIGSIYFVAPESQKIRELAKSLGCIFILEDTVLPCPEIKKHGGWIIQQFLKLNADSFVQKDHYLVVDADTIFLRPMIFTLEDGTYLTNIHWMCAARRKRMTSHLLGNTKVFSYDFVSHYMLFSKPVLAAMKKHIESRLGKRWDHAILDLFKNGNPETQPYHFSEYDLYITYLTEFSKKKFRFISSANITVYRDFLGRLESIIPAYAPQYKSISLHHFMISPQASSPKSP